MGSAYKFILMLWFLQGHCFYSNPACMVDACIASGCLSDVVGRSLRCRVFPCSKLSRETHHGIRRNLNRIKDNHRKTATTGNLLLCFKKNKRRLSEKSFGGRLYDEAFGRSLQRRRFVTVGEFLRHACVRFRVAPLTRRGITCNYKRIEMK